MKLFTKSLTTKSLILKSFTLIELLIVIVIIGVLATSLIPRLTGTQRDARNSVRQAHIQQLSQALKLYEAEHGSMPAISGVCIGHDDNQSCWPEWQKNGGGTGVGMGNANFNHILQSYLVQLPSDPISNRAVSDKYIYTRGSVPINCDGSKYVSGIWLVWVPETKGGIDMPHAMCSPGKRACCVAGLGCGSYNGNYWACVLQLN